MGFSLVASRGYSLASGCRLLIAAASLWSTGSRAWRLQKVRRVGSVVVVTGLVALAIQDLGSNPCLLHWQVGSLPLSHLFTAFAEFCFKNKTHELCFPKSLQEG